MGGGMGINVGAKLAGKAFRVIGGSAGEAIGSVLGALGGAVLGGAAGAKAGEIIDDKILNRYVCLSCNYKFSK